MNNSGQARCNELLHKLNMFETPIYAYGDVQFNSSFN